MLRGDTQVQGAHVMPGIVRGVEKRTMRPVVDGIVSGIPRKAVPSAATPTETCHASATKVPHASFGSGIFGEGAGQPARHSAEPEKKGRGRPKKAEAAEGDGTKKGEMRKTARKAYEK